MEFQTKQDVIDVLSPELTTAEAELYLPVAEANYTERIKDTDTAKKATEKCQGVCDDDGDTLRALAEMQAKASAELTELRSTLRTELYANRETCDVEGISSVLHLKTNAVEFIDSAYDYLLTVKAPADHILLLDALANQASAEFSEMSAAANLSRVKTIAALGPVIALEGANVGFIGAATETLREHAKMLAKKVEVARNASRDARSSYDRQQSARKSRGIITSANVAK
jgi:hypothetical protein